MAVLRSALQAIRLGVRPQIIKTGSAAFIPFSTKNCQCCQQSWQSTGHAGGGNYLVHAAPLSLWGGSKRKDWNKVVSDAEKLVGYPTSFMSLRCLLSDEMSNVAMHIRKLVGTKHPLLKTARGLVFDGKNGMQTRGLIVLLMSKAAGPAVKSERSVLDQDMISGIYSSQRQLAEITELIHTANLIHHGVVNLADIKPSDGPFKDMEFGNKIAVLSGDFLLANASTGLAALHCPKVVEIISSAIANMMEAEFVFTLDSDGHGTGATMDQWKEHAFLSRGSLIAKSCQSALELAHHTDYMQQKAYDYGKYMAYAYKLAEELRAFKTIEDCQDISMTSAPVILYLDKYWNKDMAELMEKRKFFAKVMSSPAMDEAYDLCVDHGNKAIASLQVFHESEARAALENIIKALTEQKPR